MCEIHSWETLWERESRDGTKWWSSPHRISTPRETRMPPHFVVESKANTRSTLREALDLTAAPILVEFKARSRKSDTVPPRPYKKYVPTENILSRSLEGCFSVSGVSPKIITIQNRYGSGEGTLVPMRAQEGGVFAQHLDPTIRDTVPPRPYKNYVPTENILSRSLEGCFSPKIITIQNRYGDGESTLVPIRAQEDEREDRTCGRADPPSPPPVSDSKGRHHPSPWLPPPAPQRNQASSSLRDARPGPWRGGPAPPRRGTGFPRTTVCTASTGWGRSSGAR